MFSLIVSVFNSSFSLDAPFTFTVVPSKLRIIVLHQKGHSESDHLTKSLPYIGQTILSPVF